MEMTQAKFTLDRSHIDFLEQFKDRGFKDKSSIVRLALDKLAQELEHQDLARSADLYAELYQEDEELRQLTDAAMIDWPT
jgi:Arc/MetJ-type ribon-helix-helix transcriptional regulator